MRKSLNKKCNKLRCDICNRANYGQNPTKFASDAAILYGKVIKEMAMFNSFIKPFYTELIENNVIKEQPTCEMCYNLIYTKSLFLEYSIFYYFYYKYKGQMKNVNELFNRIKKINKAFDDVYVMHKIKRTATSVYVYILNEISKILKLNKEKNIYIYFELGDIVDYYKKKNKKSFDSEHRLKKIENGDNQYDKKIKIVNFFDEKKSYYSKGKKIIPFTKEFNKLAHYPNYICVNIKKIYDSMIKFTSIKKSSSDNIVNEEEIRLYYEKKLNKDKLVIKNLLEKDFIKYKIENEDEKNLLKKENENEKNILKNENEKLLKSLNNIKKVNDSLKKSIEEYKSENEKLLNIVKKLEHAYTEKSIECDNLKNKKDTTLLSPNSLLSPDYFHTSFLKEGSPPGTSFKNEKPPPPGFPYKSNQNSLNTRPPAPGFLYNSNQDSLNVRSFEVNKNSW